MYPGKMIVICCCFYLSCTQKNTLDELKRRVPRTPGEIDLSLSLPLFPLPLHPYSQLDLCFSSVLFVWPFVSIASLCKNLVCINLLVEF